MKYLVILNPSAAKGAALKNQTKIEKLLEEYLLDYSLIVSAKPGDPTVLAQEAAEKDYDVVVAVGGDGTSNEIINGLMASKLEGKKIPKLAVIPAGRGNDFAASMGIPVELEDAVKAIATGKTRTIDVGQVFGGLPSSQECRVI
jgi:YegS/Rv2252/BmrU family lipid kinase